MAEDMPMETMTLGNVSVSLVREWEGPIAPPAAVLPGSSPQLWEDNRSWLAPDFWDPEADAYRAAMNTWVLRSAGKIIVVDTGIGNDKYRPYFPLMSYLQTDYLRRLSAIGVAVEDVDVVVNTHVHADHVGWNTTLTGGAWVPTFPNATYLINRVDFEYWNPLNGHGKKAVVAGMTADFGNQNMFEDSIAPIAAAGLGVLWEDSHVIDENLRLDVEAGHTPGSAVLSLHSGTDRALFVGDMVHSPVQILDPGVHSCFDEDQREAGVARRRILSRAAEQTALVLPAHFPGPGAAEVTRRGDGFAISSWAPFSRELPRGPRAGQ